MRYLITFIDNDPFFSEYFSVENDFTLGMTVYDLSKKIFTFDGENWHPIEENHL